MHSSLIGTIINLKLELADKALKILPEQIRSGIKEAGTELLTCINNELTAYLGKSPQKATRNDLQKIELD